MSKTKKTAPKKRLLSPQDRVGLALVFVLDGAMKAGMTEVEAKDIYDAVMIRLVRNSDAKNTKLFETVACNTFDIYMNGGYA